MREDKARDEWRVRYLWSVTLCSKPHGVTGAICFGRMAVTPRTTNFRLPTDFLSINGRLFAPRWFDGTRKIFQAAGGNESVMNLEPAMDRGHGERIAERHIDTTQFDAVAPR